VRDDLQLVEVRLRGLAAPARQTSHKFSSLGGVRGRAKGPTETKLAGRASEGWMLK
jgi:hypothetical protein